MKAISSHGWVITMVITMTLSIFIKRKCFEKNDTLDMTLNDIVQMLSLNDLSSHLESWFQELRSKSRPDSVFAKMPASVKQSRMFWWCFNPSIPPTSLTGTTDVGPLEKKRAFLGYPHCRRSLGLQSGKTYLLMGTSKDIQQEVLDNVLTWVCPLTYMWVVFGSLNYFCWAAFKPNQGSISQSRFNELSV